MTQTTCLTKDELNEYLCGWLDEQEMQAVEQHLGNCPNCETTLSGLEQSPVAMFPGLSHRLSDMGGDLPAQGDFSNETLRKICEMQPGAGADDAPPQKLPLLGQYQMIRCVGRGGMAQVFLAKHMKLKREFAIKVIRVSESQLSESLRRLRREIEVVGQLRHPAIVSATDAGEHLGHPYLVTEYIEGLDLSRLARRCHENRLELDSPDCCELVRQAASGIAYAHAQGVVHRDLKPSNLMLDQDGQVKILDFGLVHLVGWNEETLELTTVGQMLGTLDYMAPEQADRPDYVDPRSDVYSLGATLYRLLAGRAPHAITQQQSPLEKLRLLSTVRPTKLKTTCPDLPEALCSLVDRCLERDVQDRPASAAHLAEELEAFTAGADLKSLITKAIALPATESSPSLPFSSLNFPNAGNQKVRGWWGRTWRHVAIALVTLGMVSLAAMFWWDQQFGQLVIETDSDDVTITLLKDGESYDQLQLHPGVNSTRLYAGNYEVQIDGKVDRYQLSANSVELSRGGVVLLKVYRQTLNPTQNAGKESDAQPTDRRLEMESTIAGATDGVQAFQEPVYQGKTFGYWKSKLEFEQSMKEKQTALAALFAFQPPELRCEATALLVDYLFGQEFRGRDLARGIRRIPQFTPDAWEKVRDSFQNASPTVQWEKLDDLKYLFNKGESELQENILKFYAETASPVIFSAESPLGTAEKREEFVDWFNRQAGGPAFGGRIPPILDVSEGVSDKQILANPGVCLGITKLQERTVDLLLQHLEELSKEEFQLAHAAYGSFLFRLPNQPSPQRLGQYVELVNKFLALVGDIHEENIRVPASSYSKAWLGPNLNRFADHAQMKEYAWPVPVGELPLMLYNGSQSSTERSLIFLLCLKEQNLNYSKEGAKGIFEATEKTAKSCWSSNNWDRLTQHSNFYVVKETSVDGSGTSYSIFDDRLNQSVWLHRLSWLVLDEVGAFDEVFADTSPSKTDIAENVKEDATEDEINALTFEGKTFREWETLLKRELSPEQKQLALAAMFRFPTNILGQRTMEAFVDEITAENPASSLVAKIPNATIPDFSASQWQRIEKRFVEATPRDQEGMLNLLKNTWHGHAATDLQSSIVRFFSETASSVIFDSKAPLGTLEFRKQAIVWFHLATKAASDERSLRANFYRPQELTTEQVLENAEQLLSVPEAEDRVFEVLKENVTKLESGRLYTIGWSMIGYLTGKSQRPEASKLRVAALILNQALESGVNLDINHTVDVEEGRWLHSAAKEVKQRDAQGTLGQPSGEGKVSDISSNLSFQQAVLWTLLLLQSEGVEFETPGVQTILNNTQEDADAYWKHVEVYAKGRGWKVQQLMGEAMRFENEDSSGIDTTGVTFVIAPEDLPARQGKVTSELKAAFQRVITHRLAWHVLNPDLASKPEDATGNE